MEVGRTVHINDFNKRFKNKTHDVKLNIQNYFLNTFDSANSKMNS